MAFTVTSVAQAREMIETAREKMKKMREGAEEVIGEGIRITEISGTSLAFGYANGRWGENGELTIGGMPVDLGAAVVLHGTAFMGGLGKYSEHGHNLGTGALAAAAYRTGAKMGHAHAEKARQQHAPQQPAALPWQAPWTPLPSPQQPPGAQANGAGVPQHYAPPGTPQGGG